MHLGLKSKSLKGLRRIAAYWNAQSELDRIVATHHARVINKWRHYFEIYDRHFSRMRGREITLVEIGVAGGGSLDIWRRYFGPNARIVGLDINPDCKRFESPGTRIVIGSQGDEAFLEKFAAETGPIDILIDDGSHHFEHQLATFRALFRHVKPDGIYACEDTCTSYWQEEFGGGVRAPGTFMEFVKDLIDELNAWFWREGVDSESAAFAKTVHGIHIYPALVIIEKRAMSRPIHTPAGQTASAS